MTRPPSKFGACSGWWGTHAEPLAKHLDRWLDRDPSAWLHHLYASPDDAFGEDSENIPHT